MTYNEERMMAEAAYEGLKKENMVKAKPITMRPQIIAKCYASSKKAKPLAEWIAEIAATEEVRKQA